MKMSPAHRDKLAAAIQPLDTEARREAYWAGRFPRSDRVQDLNKRYRWDLYHAARGFALIATGDYKDAHIDTALRAIVPDLKEVS